MSSKKKEFLKSSGLAPVNDLEMYYEIHGAGESLILLPGSYMTIDLNYEKLIPELARKRQVIAVEMQGHGRTADTTRLFSYEAMADDAAELLKYLKIERADILGYSLGGTIALAAAIRHPSLIRNLIFISSVSKFDGWSKAVRDALPTITPELLAKTPIKTEYERLAPDAANWENFVGKLSAFDAATFDLGDQNIENLQCPALLVFGDSDGVELSHVIETYKLFGGGVFGDLSGLPESQLTILPGMTHVSLMEQATQLATLINSFLDKKPSRS